MAGVSLSQLRDHLKQNIPGLKEHGISKTTVSHLIEHPRQDTISARGYKRFLKTHVPVKQILTEKTTMISIFPSCCLSTSSQRCLIVSVKYLLVMT